MTLWLLSFLSLFSFSFFSLSIFLDSVFVCFLCILYLICVYVWYKWIDLVSFEWNQQKSVAKNCNDVKQHTHTPNRNREHCDFMRCSTAFVTWNATVFFSLLVISIVYFKITESFNRHGDRWRDGGVKKISEWLRFRWKLDRGNYLYRQLLAL